METRKLMSLTKALLLAKSTPIGPHTYFFIEKIVFGKPALDNEIKIYLNELIRKIHNLLSDVDAKEAENVAMYAAYQELPSKNQFMEDYMKEFGSVDCFISYFRPRLSNPFC